jgi:hypothetical protein
VKTTIPYGTGTHRIQELLSPTKNTMDISFKYLSPLFDENDVPVAFFITCRVKRLSATENLDFVETHDPATPEPSAPTPRRHLTLVK